MKRFLVMTALLSSLAVPSYAGMSEGIAAATAGDYPRAFTEFEPLAAAGDPAAQYYLAKLYLEGRGSADGVIRGVDLMTKAANGGYPEAQAQLGLMYAMGLGVDVDNVKAHEWLNKAVTALPDGMRRTVAEANRDAVRQRMTSDQRNALASRTIPATTIEPAAASAPAKAADPKIATTKAAIETPKPADTKTASSEAKKPEATQVAAKPAPTAEAPAKAEAKQPDVPLVKTDTKPAEAKPAEPDKKVTAAADKPAETKPTETKPAATQPASTANKPAETKPAATQTASSANKPVETKPAETKPATTQTASTAQSKPAEPKPAEPKPTTTQTASAAPATPATEAQVKAAVRIQVASLPTEDGAWAGWKDLSAKYAGQFTGLTPIVESADLGDLGMRYRIQVGPFQTVADANARCDAMKKAGLDCLVVGKQ